MDEDEIKNVEGSDSLQEAPQNDGASVVQGDLAEATGAPINDHEQPVVEIDEHGKKLWEDSLAKPIPAEFTESAEAKRVGKVWEVVIIREGTSLNGNYYTREALKDSIPLWEGAEVAFYGWDPQNRNHVPNHVEDRFPEGTFANHGGFLKGVKGRIREGRYELFAHFFCTQEALRKQLFEMYEHGGRLPGFSIHAKGDTMAGIREGKRVNVVTKITETKELTLVSKPAAGGTATRLIAGQHTTKMEEKINMDLIKVRAFVAGKQTVKALSEAVKAMDDKTVLEAAAGYLKEMDGGKYMKRALAALEAGEVEKAAMVLEIAIDLMEPEAAPEEPVEEMDKEEEPVYEGRAQKNERRGEGDNALAESVKAAEARLATMEKAAQLRECKSLLESKLQESKLPETFTAKIKKQFGGSVFTEATLDAEIAEMRHLVPAQIGGDAKIENTGHRAEVLVEASDKFQAGMDLFMGYQWRKAEGLTESQKRAYEAVEGTRLVHSVRALYEYGSGDERGSRSGQRGSLTEAYTNTTFSNALDTSITRVLQFAFNAMPDAEWKDFVKEVPGATLLQRDRSIVGGIGRIPTVSEGGTYPDLAQPKEYTSNYSIVKKGGIVSITEEAVLNDRIGVFQSIPDALRSAALEAELDLIGKAIVGRLGGGAINSDESYTGTVMYHANHANYSTTALSAAAVDAARTMMEKTLVFSCETALNEAANINSSVTDFDVDDATGIRVGMIVRIGAEDMEVTGVTGNNLQVVRGVRDTTPASHNDNAKVFAFAGTLPWNALGGFSMFLVVPTELKSAARVAVASKFLPGGGNNDINPNYDAYTEGKIKIVSFDSHYLGGDKNNWYTVAPWQVVPGLEFGYLDGQRAPQIVNQTNDMNEQVFLADTMRFKVKHRIGANNMFHEGRTGHIVAG